MDSTVDSTPIRSYMDDPNITWRYGSKPDYSIVDMKYIAEKYKNHKAGSLDKIVEDIVKTFEMEISHKPYLKDWKSIATDGSFCVQVNGGKKYSAEEYLQYGNYNIMLKDSPLIDVSKETFASAQKTFQEAFPGGFAWEVLEVLSGPPKVSFTWRHWATWSGQYKGRNPTGEKIEMIGSCVAEVTSDLKLRHVQVYFDPNPMMVALTGAKCPMCV